MERVRHQPIELLNAVRRIASIGVIVTVRNLAKPSVGVSIHRFARVRAQTIDIVIAAIQRSCIAFLTFTFDNRIMTQITVDGYL